MNSSIKPLAYLTIVAIIVAGCSSPDSKPDSTTPSTASTSATIRNPPGQMAGIVDETLRDAESFTLYSIHPTPIMVRDPLDENASTFHDYEILGQTEVGNADERATLINALYQGIDDSDGTVAACFNPRHGITAKSGDTTIDFVICYECHSMKIYVDGETRGSVITDASPARVFNAAVDNAGLERPTE